MADVTGVAGTTIAASPNGPQLTVNTVIKTPTFIRQYLLSIDNYLFQAEKLFRAVQNTDSGVIEYQLSAPLFSDENPATLGEFEEIPTVTAGVGTPAVARTTRKGFGIVISEQMRTRNNMDLFNTQLLQARNTLVRNFDAQWVTLMDGAVVTGANQNGSLASHVVAAGALWSNSAQTIRTDIASAAELIVAEARGFMPDSLLIDQATWWGMLGNPAAWAGLYIGDVAGQNPQFLGKVPGTLMGMEIVVTLNGNITSGNAYLMQQGIFGGISNERPLTATPWYQRQENETWRSDITRAAVGFIDQPLALAKITGVR